MNFEDTIAAMVGEARPCECGCSRPAAEGSKYYEATCRPRAYRLRHPTVDLSGFDAKAAKRAERMISDAVEAAKQGLVRATIDARHPVKHEKDERPSCRPRLAPEAWAYLEALAEDAGVPPSRLVDSLIYNEAGRVLGSAILPGRRV